MKNSGKIQRSRARGRVHAAPTSQRTGAAEVPHTPPVLSGRRVMPFFGRYWQAFMLLMVVGLIVYRGPFLLTEPRIWAEDGIYLSYALSHHLLSALFHTNPDSGYYLLPADLIAIGTAWMSKEFGLRYAPFVSTYLSLVVQLVPFAILIFGKSHVFTSPMKIFAGCAAILLAPSTDGEIWLNTINSPCWTGMAALILVFEDTSQWSRRKKYGMRVGLVLLGLSGPYAPITFPLFCLAAFIYREREHWIQGAILLCCTVVQMGVYGLTRHAGGATSRFLYSTWDSAIVNSFDWFFLTPVLGGAGAAKLCVYLGMSEALLKAQILSKREPVTLAAYFSAVVIFLLLSSLWSKRLRSESALFIISFLYLSTFTVATAAFGIPNGRYTFLPGIALLFLLLITFWTDRRVVARAVCAMLFICSMWVGVRDYRKVYYFQVKGPSWASEVQKWQKDPSYQPGVWPNGWHIFQWNPEVRR